MNLEVIKHTALFDGIEQREIEAMMSCLSAEIKTYKKGQTIYRVGDTTSLIGEVLSGSVHIIKEDFWGNRNILSQISLGQLFAETYAAMATEPLEVSVIAAETTEVLFMDVRRIMTTCSSACEFHSRLIRNLLAVTAQKNLMLTRKLEYMAGRTTKEKLLCYLSAESQRQKSAIFEIPFSRQQLADYLAVDRSAMSNELCKLRDRGVLKFEKNRFELLHDKTTTK
ncbi:MAG: Crp/Fnr family transcriptional regulator [Eubacteriales bacterium]|nr:Crp/Fnr family transcriptional regulator [Eubacteriales bacterium]